MTQFTDLAQTLARKEAWQPADADDLVQEGLIALDRALRKTTPEKPYAFARTVMQRAMQKSLAAYHRGPPPGFWVELGDMLDPVTVENGEQEGLIDFASYFASLERVYGTEARTIAESLLARVEGGENHVRERLGFSKARWGDALVQIRTFTEAWLAGKPVDDLASTEGTGWRGLVEAALDQPNPSPALRAAVAALARAYLAAESIPVPEPKQSGPGPVAQVWAIADQMKNATRRVVVTACIAAGINEHTARTQYQRWRRSHKS